ncbi:MAG: exodeoxyribonuclease VII large subunit, partial [Clostridiales bacterium]|nr:exodeoxyribonuclease VII large subunit [Clostridiales bacterium]
MAKPVYSVGQLAGYIAGILDAEELLRGICIDGEVSEMTTSGGNTYFTMKDAVAQLSCIYFGGRPDVAVGDRVVATGSPRYYVKGGKLSFIASLVEKKGEGDLYAQFALLKAKLEAAGVFSRKIQPPPEIRRIGIVTSPTGAVIRDIMNVAFRRNPNVNLVLYPAKVQGPGAAEAVAEAVHILDAAGRVDAIVVARGGGSMEDLAPFNTEVVARAVADCKTYIVSAVGHETDFSLCDFSADLRAPTPSAAAELLVRDVRADLRQITALA